MKYNFFVTGKTRALLDNRRLSIKREERLVRKAGLRRIRARKQVERRRQLRAREKVLEHNRQADVLFVRREKLIKRKKVSA